MAGKKMEIKLLAITPNADNVIEQAGRTCYLSFEKMNADSATDFIRRIVKAGHESVLEHAYATFRIKGCSRAMTHQLVRHRLMGISQQSQRYVNENAFDYVIPQSLPDEDIEDYKADMAAIQKMYEKWRNRGLKKEDARFVLPNACCSEIVVSANFREWRHIIKMRTSPKAQWEIREAAREILRILNENSNAVFGDLAEQILNKPAANKTN